MIRSFATPALRRFAAQASAHSQPTWTAVKESASKGILIRHQSTTEAALNSPSSLGPRSSPSSTSSSSLPTLTSDQLAEAVQLRTSDPWKWSQSALARHFSVPTATIVRTKALRCPPGKKVALAAEVDNRISKQVAATLRRRVPRLGSKRPYKPSLTPWKTTHGF